MSTKKKSEKKYGVHSEVVKLHKVMVCAPGKAHNRLTPSNCDELLFDDVLWVERALLNKSELVTTAPLADRLLCDPDAVRHA